MIWSGRALSVSQPFATALASGAKPVENRSTPLGRKHVPCWLGLHAAKSWYPLDDRKLVQLWPERPWNVTPGCGLEKYPRGVMLGLMYIDWAAFYPDPEADERLTENELYLIDDEWAFGPWCLHVAKVLLLPEPIPCPGMLGLWTISPSVREPLDRLLEEAS